MNTLPESDWRGTPVETVSGISIGRLHSVEIDPETHRVAFYHVRRRRLVPGGPDLLVHPKQVVSLTEEKMVVEELVLRDGDAQARVAVTATPALPASR